MALVGDPERWDQRYREGSDGWELGRPAPPLELFLCQHPAAPRAGGLVLVPGCGRGHEAALLAELKLEPRYLAVERNRVLVPRRQHASCTLEEGDQLEIVTLVGGG